MFFLKLIKKELFKKYSEEDREKLFVLKPLYQRVLIVFGGPLANFLLALVIFFQFILSLEKILLLLSSMRFKRIVPQWLVD